jgi:hypothetical protein
MSNKINLLNTKYVQTLINNPNKFVKTDKFGTVHHLFKGFKKTLSQTSAAISIVI